MFEQYDRRGNPVSTEELYRLWRDPREKIVAKTRVGQREPVEVSTVWIGIDHSFTLEGPPLIFETMVFGGKYDQEMERYSTEQEALEGHARMVRRVSFHGWKYTEDFTEAFIRQMEQHG